MCYGAAMTVRKPRASSPKTTKLMKALGVMTGTSMDGVDVAAIATDGQGQIAFIGSHYLEFTQDLRARLLAIATGDVPLNEVLRAEFAYSEVVCAALNGFEREHNVKLSEFDVIGVHGQTIRHLPDEGLTWQLGNPSLIAERAGVPVVMDFRRRDMAAGGQGAPFASLYHAALLAKRAKPCAVLNIGGVANLTWLGEGGVVKSSDCGPGVGLLNTWVQQHTGHPFDADGKLALAGTADWAVVKRLAELPFWQKIFPRTADRHEFAMALSWLHGKSTEDGAATLAACTAEGVLRTLNALSGGLNCQLLVAGGGAKNPAILAALKHAGLWCLPLESEGLRGDTLEAEAFAWLAVRRVLGLPLSTPDTTGARHSTIGGVVTA